MSAEAITNALLTADTAVVALVGARIFPVVLPDMQRLAALTYEQVIGVDIGTMGADQYFGSKQSRIQIDAYGEDFAKAKAVQRAAVRALRFQRGVVAGVPLVAIVPDNEATPGWDPDRKLFVCYAQLIVYWRDT